MKSLDEISAGWIEFTKRSNPVTGDLKPGDPADIEGDGDWSDDDLFSLIYWDFEKSLDCIYKIAEHRDDWVLQNLGAGPIETLLRLDPQRFLSAIAERPKSLGVAEALRSVWVSGLSEEGKSSLISYIRQSM